MAKATHPFRDAMVLLTIRNHLANKMVSDLGYTRAEARAAAHELSDDVIEQAAVQAFGADTPKLGAGGGILDFLTKLLAAAPQLAALLTLLLSLFGGAAVPPPPPPLEPVPNPV